MKFHPPTFWTEKYGRASAPITRALLTPLSWIYARATAKRIAKTTPFDPGIPVICVGNATAGGSGKTPVAAEILTMLRQNKINAQGLTRGYGGSEKGPVLVGKDHRAEHVGDEALLLSSRAPVWVAAGRDDGARTMAAYGAQAIVMDDGHQNPLLQKTLSLLVVDAVTGFGNGRVIPAGPLREPVSAALDRTDAVILMKPDRDFTPDEELLDELKGLPLIEAYLAPTSPMPKGKLYAFAGIGRPNKFFDSLRADGADLAEAVRFPDHHKYSEGELKHLLKLSREHKAQLITTEKDFVRLPDHFRQYVAVRPVRAVFMQENRLEQLLSPIIDLAKRGKRK